MKCGKCGAQLHTGVFQRPTVELADRKPRAGRWEANSIKRKLIAFWVFLLAASALVFILRQLESGLR